MKTKDTYNRARIEILNYILSFSTNHYYGQEKKGYTNTSIDIEKAFRGGYSTDKRPPIGSLVVLLAAPFTKYYLSWYIQCEEGGLGGRFLLKSIEDGSLCWWTNVAFKWYPLEESNKHPQWKWSDKQFEFWDRWRRACKRRDAYITLGVMPQFTDDGGVILATRERYDLSPYKAERKFDNWKKVKFKDMLEFYDYAVESRPS